MYYIQGTRYESMQAAVGGFNRPYLHGDLGQTGLRHNKGKIECTPFWLYHGWFVVFPSLPSSEVLYPNNSRCTTNDTGTTLNQIRNAQQRKQNHENRCSPHPAHGMSPSLLENPKTVCKFCFSTSCAATTTTTSRCGWALPATRRGGNG